MAESWILTRGWQGDGDSLQIEESIESGAELKISEAVADSETDLEVACVLDQSQLKALYIKSDQVIKIETNSGSEAADTFDLVADLPMLWSVTDGNTVCPITTDITALFITNSSGSTANLIFKALYDPTV